MLKKAFLSTFIFSIIIVNLFLWPTLIKEFTKKSEGKQANIEEPTEKEETANIVKEINTVNQDSVSSKGNSVNEDSLASNTNSDYIYALTTEEIEMAIQDGVNNRNAEDRFSLPSISMEESDIIYRAIIDTPYNKVATRADVTYFDEDKIITLAEAKNVINYDRLSFAVYFRNGFARVFGVSLIQDNKVIQQADVLNDDGGYFKILFYNVNDIDFKKPAYLNVFEKGGRQIETQEYEINFYDYIYPSK